MAARALSLALINKLTVDWNNAEYKKCFTLVQLREPKRKRENERVGSLFSVFF